MRTSDGWWVPARWNEGAAIDGNFNFHFSGDAPRDHRGSQRHGECLCMRNHKVLWDLHLAANPPAPA